MSLRVVKSMAVGFMATLVVVAFAAQAFAQETPAGDQKSEQTDSARQKQRMQKRADGKQESKPGDKKAAPGAEGRRRMPPKEGDAAGPAQRIMQALKKMDVDGDGTISKAEAPERLLARFDRIDANGDEKIDQQEIAAMIKKMGERAGAKPGDRPPMTDRPRDKNGAPTKKSEGKDKKKMTDRAPEQNDSSGGSVEPIRPGKDG